jgi:hypothetical protein
MPIASRRLSFHDRAMVPGSSTQPRIAPLGPDGEVAQASLRAEGGASLCELAACLAVVARALRVKVGEPNDTAAVTDVVTSIGNALGDLAVGNELTEYAVSSLRIGLRGVTDARAADAGRTHLVLAAARSISSIARADFEYACEATLVSLIPASCRADWWIPRRLDRILPRLDVEPAAQPAGEGTR